MKTDLNHFFGLLLSLLFFACSNSVEPDNPKPPLTEDSYTVVKAFPQLSFNKPIDLQHSNDGSGRLFVVEQSGRIYVFENDSQATTKQLFLDLSDRIISGGERGLLGLTFHTNYENNGYFYVNYTAPNPLHTVISRFQVSASNPNQADINSETILLTFEQPFSNHNGGQIRFGPDGYLYIATGDGGSGGDPLENGQNNKVFLGKILRIDVNGNENGKSYTIPSDNPYAGNNSNIKEEIYAYGFRNPWRFSFDANTGKLWVADVGQNQWEEINIVEKGGNYGWNIMEGKHCYNASTCDKTGLILPIWEYNHDVGQSITGGFVYRGSRMKQLSGFYIYADFISGRIWALNFANLNKPENTLLIDTDLNISSFGVDAYNNLYLCSFDGFIYRLELK